MTFNVSGNGYGAEDITKLSKSAQRGIAAFDENKDGAIQGKKEIKKISEDLIERLSGKDGDIKSLSRKESRALAKELRNQGYDVSARDLRNAYRGIIGLSIERGDAIQAGEANLTGTISEERTSRPKNKVFTDPTTGEQIIHEFTYDDLGRKSKTNVSSGEVIEYAYEGDSKNPAVQTLKDKEGNLVEKREFTYDAQGNLASTKYYDANGLVQTVEADLDPESKDLAEVNVVRNTETNMEDTDQLAARNFDYDNGQKVKHNYGYDAQGRKALVQVSTGEKISYAYQGKNTQPSEQVVRDANNNLISRETFTYDTAGNKTKSEFYNANNELESTTTFEYADGREIRRERKTGDATYIDETTYLADGGKTVTSTMIDADNNVQKYVASFDAKGNEIEPPEDNLLAQQ